MVVKYSRLLITIVFKKYSFIESLWQHIKKISQDPVLKKKIFLGYGKQDKHKGQTLLASVIPAKQVIALPGRHRDKVFVKLWEQMFKRGFFD